MLLPLLLIAICHCEKWTTHLMDLTWTFYHMGLYPCANVYQFSLLSLLLSLLYTIHTIKRPAFCFRLSVSFRQEFSLCQSVSVGLFFIRIFWQEFWVFWESRNSCWKFPVSLAAFGEFRNLSNFQMPKSKHFWIPIFIWDFRNLGFSLGLLHLQLLKVGSTFKCGPHVSNSYLVNLKRLAWFVMAVKPNLKRWDPCTAISKGGSYLVTIRVGPYIVNLEVGQTL